MRIRACEWLALGLLALVGCMQTSPPPADNSSNNDNGSANDNVNTNGGVQLRVDLEIPNEGASHVQTGTQVTYVANPPASGTHWPSPAAAGFYESAVEEEAWVHSLEHGYIVVLYDCDGACDPALIEALQDLLETAPPSTVFGFAKIVITPYEGLPEPALITAVAWDVQMHLDAFDEEALLDFYERYLDQGPELAP